jgi:hypothetical protein
MRLHASSTRRARGTTRISTRRSSRPRPATKQKDAVKIARLPRPGARDRRDRRRAERRRAKGAVIGGAAGTGYVLATRGKDVAPRRRRAPTCSRAT